MTLPDADATRRLGAALARACRPGTVLLVRGPLGAGKTTLIHGLVGELGGGMASSPTFVIAHSYPHARIPVWHLDFYRLRADEIEELDLDQYVRADALTCVEWPERAEHSWPEDRIEIDLAVDGEHRRARITNVADRASRGPIQEYVGPRDSGSVT